MKEKFGALRVYWDISNLRQGEFSRVEGFVEALESMSVRLCEACGAKGKVRDERSWVLTLCDACDAKDRRELRTLLETTEQIE